MESGGGSRRHQSVTEEKVESPNLRDFLRVKEEDNGRDSLAGLTLGAVISAERRLTPVHSNRTLLDVIRDDSIAGGKDSKKSWKSFRDKLRLRRAGAAWTSTVTIPASDVPIQQNTNRMITRRHSTRYQATNVSNSDDPTRESTHPELNSVPSSRAMMLRRNSSRIPERQGSRIYTSGINVAESAARNSEEEEETAETTEEAAAEGEGQPQVRMSLMTLLAETDRQMGLDGSAYIMDEDEEEEEEEEQSGGGGEYNNCCVCMVRHKGAAFIPCGHTFCRLCSRELWVQRGNCPICNNFILEILDIF